MKKIFIALSLAVVTFAANAQDQAAATTAATSPILSKRGYAILPEAGDWGLSIDAAPLLGYIGNAFHGTSNNTPNTANGNPMGFPSVNIPGITTSGTATNIVGITGKYFLDANTAVRGRLNLSLGSTTSKTEVQVLPVATPPSYTTNSVKVSGSTIVIAAGIEKRKGIGRVQGFYGAELLISSNNGSTTTNSYGNPINSNNPVVGEITKTKVGGNFLIGPRAFVGAEYFIAPKMSLGT